MKTLWRKTQAGLIPSEEAARDWFDKQKMGRDVMVETTAMRNGSFHRKWFALLQLAYDYWSETCQTLDYRGVAVLPEFERFRKDVTIVAGYYHPVVNLKGEIRIEANSISFASMSQATFEKLYDATITALINKVFNGDRVKQWTEGDLRRLVEQLLEFS